MVPNADMVRACLSWVSWFSSAVWFLYGFAGFCCVLPRASCLLLCRFCRFLLLNSYRLDGVDGQQTRFCSLPWFLLVLYNSPFRLVLDAFRVFWTLRVAHGFCAFVSAASCRCGCCCRAPSAAAPPRCFCCYRCAVLGFALQTVSPFLMRLSYAAPPLPRLCVFCCCRSPLRTELRFHRGSRIALGSLGLVTYAYVAQRSAGQRNSALNSKRVLWTSCATRLPGRAV